MPSSQLQPTFSVDLPGGGTIYLQTAEEVDIFEKSREGYMDEYGFNKPNDLILLGIILTEQLSMFRAQTALNGMVPELDANDVPTGNYRYEELKDTEKQRLQKMIQSSSQEIRELEKTLGIDKKTREAGGQHTLANYMENLKLAGTQYGVHISKRGKAFEQFCMDLRWKLRLLRNGDEEDRAHHDISPEKLLTWAEEQLAELEEVDKKYANERGKVWVGKL